MSNKVVVVGGGAAGLIAAGTAALNGADVTVIERNSRVARKVMITGKGRCNLTNATDSDGFFAAVRRNPRFLFSAYHGFSSADTMSMFESLGVPLKVERGNRVFPMSDKAVDIVDALHKYASNNGANITCGRVKALIINDGRLAGVKLESGEKINCERVIIATGGLSYPKTGSDGDGYALAKQAGHTVVKPRPSLVPLEICENICARLQGLSLKNVKVTLLDRQKQKVLFSEQGEMIFTHYGVSGPLILSLSSFIDEVTPERYEIFIDLKPALDEKQLDHRILRDFEEEKNKDYINSLGKLLPSKLIAPFVRLTGIGEKRKVNTITKAERQKIVSTMKNIKLTVYGFRPIDEAIVTAGGVSTAEINPKNMESKLLTGLYFAGEVIDVDAYTGGFNLQIAFSTGYAAANGLRLGK